MKNLSTDQDLYAKAKEVLDVSHKKIVNVLINRKKIVDNLFADWTDDEKSCVRQEIINPHSFRDALGLCWLNGDVDTLFYTSVMKLLDKGLFREKELNEAYEFLYDYC